MVDESRRIPINSNWVEGENVLPGARGISRSVNRVRRLQSAILHWERGGGSAIKKSSRMCRTPLMFSLLRIIPSRSSETKLKRKGALRRPKGSTVSKK